MQWGQLEVLLALLQPYPEVWVQTQTWRQGGHNQRGVMKQDSVGALRAQGIPTIDHLMKAWRGREWEHERRWATVKEDDWGISGSIARRVPEEVSSDEGVGCVKFLRGVNTGQDMSGVWPREQTTEETRSLVESWEANVLEILSTKILILPRIMTREC